MTLEEGKALQFGTQKQKHAKELVCLAIDEWALVQRSTLKFTDPQDVVEIDESCLLGVPKYHVG